MIFFFSENSDKWQPCRGIDMEAMKRSGTLPMAPNPDYNMGNNYQESEKRRNLFYFIFSSRPQYGSTS